MIAGSKMEDAKQDIAPRTLGEASIKAKVLNFLRSTGEISRKSIVASELPIPGRTLRADLAILSDRFIGIEIKSEVDSLRRLPSQIESYFEIFDRVIVVLAVRHFRVLDKKLLDAAELWEVDTNGAIRVVRKARAHRPLASFSSLMTQEEKKRFIGEDDLFNRKVVDLDPIARRKAERENFEAAFRYRFGGTSEQFWQGVGRRLVNEADLLLLSRFHPRRQRQRRWRETQAAFWRDWASRAEGMFGTECSPH